MLLSRPLPLLVDLPLLINRHSSPLYKICPKPASSFGLTGPKSEIYPIVVVPGRTQKRKKHPHPQSWNVEWNQQHKPKMGARPKAGMSFRIRKTGATSKARETWFLVGICVEMNKADIRRSTVDSPQFGGRPPQWGFWDCRLPDVDRQLLTLDCQLPDHQLDLSPLQPDTTTGRRRGESAVSRWVSALSPLRTHEHREVPPLWNSGDVRTVPHHPSPAPFAPDRSASQSRHRR
jgi:hypothetical protein